VEGQVFTSDGVEEEGAEVTLFGQSLFGTNHTVVSDMNGFFRFDGIFVGPYSLRSTVPASRLVATNSGNVNFEGDIKTSNLILNPAGDLTGMIFENDATTTVEGAKIKIFRGGSLLAEVTSNSAGKYSAENLPLGNYQVNVLRSSNGDQGQENLVIDVAGTTVAKNVVLNGLGTVNVTVEDANGDVVPNAQVQIRSLTVFNVVQSGISDDAGVATFANVLAGSFSITAMDPVNRLGGQIGSNVDVGETVDVTVALEPAGDITGTVFLFDGVTPAANIKVGLQPFNLTVTTAADGRFRFDMLPIANSPYTLSAREAFGGLHSTISGIVISTHDEEVVQDITLKGRGDVTGRIFSVDGVTPVGPGVPVTFDPDRSGFPSRITKTDTDGFFLFSDMIEGSFGLRAIISNAAVFLSLYTHLTLPTIYSV